jgi:hypothetical protein
MSDLLPRTRAEAKAAAREMATEAVKILAEHYATLTPDQMTEDREDRLLEAMAQAMHTQAEAYRAAGVPPLWVAKFKSTFIRTAGEQCREFSLLLRPIAGTA